MSKFTYELQAKTLKFILLNQFVKIDVEQLEDYAHVIAEYKKVEPRGKREREREREEEKRKSGQEKERM